MAIDPYWKTLNINLFPENCKVKLVFCSTRFIHPARIPKRLKQRPASMVSIQKQLTKYKRTLHNTDNRNNLTILDSLLSTEFREVRKPGRSFNVNSIASMVQMEKNSKWIAHSQDHKYITLSEPFRLRLFRTAHNDQQENPYQFCKLPSIWIFNKRQKQIKYHQGTTCETFSIDENNSAKQQAHNL